MEVTELKTHLRSQRHSDFQANAISVPHQDIQPPAEFLVRELVQLLMEAV